MKKVVQVQEHDVWAHCAETKLGGAQSGEEVEEGVGSQRRGPETVPCSERSQESTQRLSQFCVRSKIFLWERHVSTFFFFFSEVEK